MEEHFKLFIWSGLIVASLVFINDVFGTRHLGWFLAALFAFFFTLMFIFHGNILSIGLIGQIVFSAFMLVFAGIVLFYFLQLRLDLIGPLMKT